MSKLYSMIEDALTKKGLSIPSDSFVFSKDVKPENEVLNKTSTKDDIYTEADDKESDGLNTQKDSSEFYDHFLPAFNAVIDKKKTDLEAIIKSDKEYKKELEAEFKELKKIKNPSDKQKEKIKEVKQGISDMSTSITDSENNLKVLNDKNKIDGDFKDWLDWLADNNISGIQAIILRKPEEVVDLYFSLDSKKDIKEIIKKLGDTYSYQPKTSELKGVEFGINWKNNPDIISVKANKNDVESRLVSYQIDPDFMYGAFKFDDGFKNPLHLCTIAGVEKDGNNFVYLAEWTPRQGNENGVYKASNTYIKAPVSMVRDQLITQEPEYLTGMPSNLENKGEYWPLTDAQIEKVLLQCMYDYVLRRRTDPIFALDLIKTYRENPKAKVIKDALELFDPGHKIMGNTIRGIFTYYIFIPYVGATNNFEIGSNPELKRFNQLARQ